jgi:hypothetical protein
MVSEISAVKIKPFSDGEMKECLEEVADVAFPDRKQIISNISLSRFIIGKELKNSQLTLKKAYK